MRAYFGNRIISLDLSTGRSLEGASLFTYRPSADRLLRHQVWTSPSEEFYAHTSAFYPGPRSALGGGVKAFVDEARCPAESSICPVLSSCPQGAVAYCRDESAPLGGRIVIDLESCDGCGQCVTDCCGHAIELKENDLNLPQ